MTNESLQNLVASHATALQDLLNKDRASQHALERLENHDAMRRADVSALGNAVVELREQLAALAERCQRLEAEDASPEIMAVLEDVMWRLAAKEPPLPEPPTQGSSLASAGCDPCLDELLGSAAEYAAADDPIRLYACLWRIVVRGIERSRGLAEYARYFAERREWSSCRSALVRLMRSAEQSDVATAAASLRALNALAREQQLGCLDWRPWIERAPAELLYHPDRVELLQLAGDNESAAFLVPAMRYKFGSHAETWIVAAIDAFNQDDLSYAYDCWRKAVSIDLPLTIHAAVTVYSAIFGHVLSHKDPEGKFADWLSERCTKYPRANLMSSSYSISGRRTAERQRALAKERGLPSVFLVTQYNSGSISVGSIFNHGFALPSVLYALSNVHVVRPWLDDYLTGGACHVTHLMPSARNIEMLANAGVDSVIVHVRDPRQAAVSWVRHATANIRTMPPSARASIESGASSAIDFFIDLLLPELVNFLVGWAFARNRLPIHFTSYEAFIRDRRAFVEHLLSLYPGDRRYFDEQAALNEHPGIDYHRRVGETHEWQRVLTVQQIDRIHQVVPPTLWSVYGWPA